LSYCVTFIYSPNDALLSFPKTNIKIYIKISVWQAEAQLQPATRIPSQPSHTETPTHIETRTHNQCGETIEKPQAPDNGRINVRNMLSIEDLK